MSTLPLFAPAGRARYTPLMGLSAKFGSSWLQMTYAWPVVGSAAIPPGNASPGRLLRTTGCVLPTRAGREVGGGSVGKIGGGSLRSGVSVGWSGRGVQVTIGGGQATGVRVGAGGMVQ